MKYMDVYGVEHEMPSFQFKPRTGLFLDPNMQRKRALFSSENQAWATPIWLYEHIKKLRGIKQYDTDPATNKSNPLGCSIYYTEETDGLNSPWKGKVFINPPFGYAHYRGKWTYLTGLWIEAAWKRVFELKEVDLVTMLIPARTSTKAYHKYIWDYERAGPRDNVVVNFYPKRIKFGNSKLSAPFDSLIVDFVKPGFCGITYIRERVESPDGS